MGWASWDQATIAAVVSLVAMLAVTRWVRGPARDFLAAALQEFALVAVLYAVWRLARQLPFTHTDGAVDRARWLDDLQQSLHLPTEIALQHVVVDHGWLAWAANAYYATLHVPALIAFLVWMFVRHRDRYPHWRNGLAGLTAFCLVIRFLRVAPPRFVPELGFVDLSDRFGLAVYGPVGSSVSDQYAAMPSIHVGWAAVVALGVFASTTSRWRWVVLLHLPLTVLVVAATGHHWWIDGAVAVALLGLSLRVDTLVRRRAGRRRTEGELAHVVA